MGAKKKKKKKKKKKRVPRAAAGTQTASTHTVRTSVQVVLDRPYAKEDKYFLDGGDDKSHKTAKDATEVDQDHGAIVFDKLSPAVEYHLIQHRADKLEASVFQGKLAPEHMTLAGTKAPKVDDWFVHLTVAPAGNRNQDPDLDSPLPDFVGDVDEPKTDLKAPKEAGK